MKTFKRKPGSPRTRGELARQLRALAARIPVAEQRDAVLTRLNLVLPGKTT